MADAPPTAAAPDGQTTEPPPKPKRGKPKDDQAPTKPKNAYQKFTGEARKRLKEEQPELAADLRAMGLALKGEWGQVSDEEKARMTEQYEEEMEIWRPKWAEYKKTPHYKEFFEIKQDWIDKRAIKKLIKKQDAPKRPKAGYMIFAGEIRDRVKEEVFKAGGSMLDMATSRDLRRGDG